MTRRELVKLRILGVLMLMGSFAVAISGATDPGSRTELVAGVSSATVSAGLGFGLIARRRNRIAPVEEGQRTAQAPGWVRGLAVALPVLLLASPLRGAMETIFIVGAGLIGGMTLGVVFVLPAVADGSASTPE